MGSVGTGIVERAATHQRVVETQRVVGQQAHGAAQASVFALQQRSLQRHATLIGSPDVT